MQTIEGFRLTDLVEIDFFLQEITKDTSLVKISKESWKKAKEALDSKYNRSSILENCHVLLDTFSRVTPEGVYVNDFRTFLYESRLDDFLVSSKDCVQIGTMHKAKGKEFDSVFIYAPYDRGDISPEERRALYVAVTRAKKYLSIHTNVRLFDAIRAPNLTHLIDHSVYPLPSELILQAWHADVHLDYFRDPYRQKIYRNLHSGDRLEYRDGSCYYRGCPIIRFSNSFKERLQKIASNGYHPYEVFVRYVVFWKKQETNDRSLILLPELRFERYQDESERTNPQSDVSFEI